MFELQIRRRDGWNVVSYPEDLLTAEVEVNALNRSDHHAHEIRVLKTVDGIRTQVRHWGARRR